MGQSPSSEAYNLEFKGIPLIQGNADCVQRFTKPRLYTTEITKKCYPSDILMSVRAPVGSILYSLHEACIGRGICVIKPLDAVNNSFLFHFLVYYENKWERVSQGSTFESVNGDDIRRLLINIPNLKEQNKIAGFLTTIDDEITKQNEVLAELKIQKKSLMQKLLTGQVRAWIPAYAGMTE